MSLLLGEPQSWAHRLLEQESPLLQTLHSFFVAMAQLYKDPQRAATAESILYTLQQGHRPVEDYVVEFHKWGADRDWNEAALHYQFCLGLSEPLKDELARGALPDSLEGLIQLAIQLDQRLRDRQS